MTRDLTFSSLSPFEGRGGAKGVRLRAGQSVGYFASDRRGTTDPEVARLVFRETSGAPTDVTPHSDMNQSRIESVEVLRGLAALAVTWFHLMNGHDSNWVSASGAYGWLGVEVFFVVSGFIIPYSIWRSYPRFTLRDFLGYMSRRLVRLEPHDLEGAVTVRCRQHDLGPPDKLARRVAIADQGLKFSTVGGAKVKADVRASHVPYVAYQAARGNSVSGGEH